MGLQPSCSFGWLTNNVQTCRAARALVAGALRGDGIIPRLRNYSARTRRLNMNAFKSQPPDFVQRDVKTIDAAAGHSSTKMPQSALGCQTGFIASAALA